MLTTVKVPVPLQPLFERAQEYVSRYFQEKKEDPSKGTIEIFGERYILVRAASMSVDFFDTVAGLYGGEGEEALNIARQLLFDIAHAIGRQDARAFHKKMNLIDPIEKLSVGPVHFSHAGWAFVDVFPESNPTQDIHGYLLYDHPYSFESAAWIASGKRVDFPVCIMNAGYSSGWCEESLGVTLVASEILCQAKGDPACRFVMAPPSRIEAHIASYVQRKPDLAEKITRYEVPGFFKRKEIEAELKESERRYRRLNAELDQRVEERTRQLLEAQEELIRQEKLAILGKVVGSVGHEIRNPIGVINNAAFFLKTVLGDSGETVREYLDIIGKEVAATEQIVSDLIDFVRTKTPQLQAVSLSELIARSLERSLVPGNILVESSVPAPLPVIHADPGQIERVLVNLVKNAVEAMSEGGTLRIGVTEDAQERVLKVGVSDAGPGISPENMPKIFQPLFTTKARGLGLGLVVGKNLVEANGGRIRAESAPGKGTTFTLSFPIPPETEETTP